MKLSIPRKSNVERYLFINTSTHTPIKNIKNTKRPLGVTLAMTSFSKSGVR